MQHDQACRLKLFELMWFGFNGPFNECSGKNNYKTFLKLNFCEPQVINEEFQGNFCTFFPISRIKHFQADAISIIRHFLMSISSKQYVLYFSFRRISIQFLWYYYVMMYILNNHVIIYTFRCSIEEHHYVQNINYSTGLVLCVKVLLVGDEHLQ